MDAENRPSVGFFVLYFVVLLFALGWAHFPHVRRHTGGDLTPIYVLLACTFCYVVLRAYLVLGGRVSQSWDSVWLAMDLFVVSAAVYLTGGILSEAGLMYFWPIATSSIQRRPRRTVAVGLVSALLYIGVAALPEPLSAEHAYKLVGYVFVLLLATSLAASYARAEAARVEEMARLRAKVALADYRTRLSREMHDGIQHYLVNIAMRLEMAKLTMTEDPAEAARMATDERLTVRQAADELRYLVRRLRSPILERRGFVAALREHVSRFAERCRISAPLEIEGSAGSLPPDVEHAALRIVQEALTNAEKHAQASEVRVRLRFGSGVFECVIADDGAGFQRPGKGSDGGLGIASMEERAEAVGGRLQMTSAPGEGTKISFTVPVEALVVHHPRAAPEERPDAEAGERDGTN